MAISKNFKSKTPIEVSVTTGTAPLVVASTTLVPNLNVERLSGYLVNTGTVLTTIPVRDGSGDLAGNILGNAATVTNGVYTTGNYSNPTWLTGLAWSKISATPTTLAGYGIIDAQTLDADLTAIAALSGTSGFLKKTAADTWSLDTATYLTANQTITLTGDVTGTGNGSFATTLAASGVTAGSYTGSVTVNSKGLVTAAAALTAADVTTALTYTPVNKAGDTMTGLLLLSADPVAALGAATKQYVDNISTGLDFKQSVRAISTSNITLSGTQTVDGVALIAGNRILVAGQTTASANGIYVVAAGAWTRATDADNSGSTSEVTSGMYCFVEEGTSNADSGWILATNSTITLGTTALTFTQFNGLGQITAGTGLSKSGSTISIANTAVTAGAGYNTFTVNAQGQITLASTTAYLTANQTITLTGDVTGTGNGSFATTLANSGVTAGTYNNAATTVTPLTIDAKGRITATGSAVTIAPLFASITSKPTTLSGYGITDAVSTSVINLSLGNVTCSTITTTSIATTPVDTFAVAAYRTANYICQITNGTSYNTIHITVIHDATNVYINQYLEIFTGTSEGVFDADISGGNVRLLFTAATTNSTVVKVIRTCINI